MAEVGIVVTADSGAAKVALDKFGAGAKQTLRSVRSVADKGKDAFALMGSAIRTMNAALGIGRQAWAAMRLAVSANVAEALKFRKAGDPVLKWFADMKRESRLLKASIGDALIPVIQGLAEGLGLVGDGAQKWVQANRRLIGTKILEWTVNLGRILIKSVAAGALVVTKAWSGWQQIVLLTQTAAARFFGVLLRGTRAAIEGMGSLARALGQDGIANSLTEASVSVGLLGDVFEESGDKSFAALQKSVAEAAALEAKINSIADVALVKLATASEIAQKRIANSVTGTNNTLEEQAKAAEARRAAAAAAEEARIERLKELRAAAAEKQRLALEKQQAMIDVVSGAFGQMTTGIVDGFFAQEDAGKAAAKAVALAVIDAAVASIAGHAAVAAAGAFQSQAAIPIIGPALGAVASVTVGAAVAALGAGLKGLVGGLADGGAITGGTPGRDSVGPFMAMPGEQMMSVSERRGMQKFMSRLLGAQAGQSGGLAPSGTAVGGSQPVVINQTTEVRTWTPQLNEEMRMARQLEQRSRKRLQRQGMLLGQGAT